MERGEALRLAKEEAKERWPFDTIAEDYRALSELESYAGTETEDRPGGYDPNWDIRTKTAIDLIREERYNVRREVRHRKKLEDEARERAKGKL